MYKFLTVTVLLLSLLSISGCKKNVPQGELSPTTGQETQTPTQAGTTEATQPPKRVNVIGEEITTGYADGTFKKVENGTLIIDCNGTERAFLLTPRAERDISVLEIGEGQRIIVNFNVKEGAEEAESIEKILSEETDANIVN